MKREHFNFTALGDRHSGEARFNRDSHHEGHHDGHRGWPERPGGGFGPGYGRGFGPGFGPGFGGPRRRAKGDVRSAILSLLADGPQNGYGLMKSIGEKTDGAWRVSPGSVYPTLQQLVDEELIAASGDGRGTEYTLTDAGRDYVAGHQDELDAAWNATPKPTESATELFEAIGKLMGVVGQFRHGATDAQRKAATEKLDEARRALYLILAD
jgi:DNA-binding PadR family transcriptional regulator